MTRCPRLVRAVIATGLAAIVGAALAVTKPAGAGREVGQAPTFRAGTHTVSLYATAVDATQRLVSDLSADDFEVLDDGQPQTLTVFANVIQPITVVIMLDRSGSMVGNFTVVKDAAAEFVGHLLAADRARLGSFSADIKIDPPAFTSDHEALARVLQDNLQPPGPTPLWNATAVAMNAVAAEDGRRVVLVFTDGFDNPQQAGPNLTFDDVRRQSEAQGVMVYGIGLADGCRLVSTVALRRSEAAASFGQQFIRFERQGRSGGGRGGGRGPAGPRPPPTPSGRGPGIPLGPVVPVASGPGAPLPPTDFPGESGRGGATSLGGGCSDDKPDPDLAHLAAESGGGYFELTGTADLGATFTRVADELHHQYLLAFTVPKLDGQIHTLEVKMRRPGVVVRARHTYVATADTAPPGGGR